MIGIHFRDYVEKYDKADGRVFNKESPIEQFTKMLDIITKNTKCNIYLSSNSLEITELFKKKYDRVISYTDVKKVTYTRDAVDGIKHAIIQMLILSKCDLIVGTFHSSFSDEACFFNLVSKICIKCDTKENTLYHCHGLEKILDNFVLVPKYNVLVKYLH